MKTIKEQQFKSALVRLLQGGDGYAAIVITGAQRSEPIFGDDADEVWAQALRSLGQSSPSFFGYDGARSRFAKIFPDGFGGQAFVASERNYKAAASEFLNTTVPLEQAADATPEACDLAAKAYSKTNMLSVFEHARVRETLKSDHGADFLRGAAAFANGDYSGGLSAMAAALKPFGHASWPVVTYLPFLWRPEAQMFLKPMITCDFAERVGHEFSRIYSAELKAPVYESLLSLVEETRAQVESLGPRDLIDVQSFIWVVGAYTEEDALALKAGA